MFILLILRIILTSIPSEDTKKELYINIFIEKELPISILQLYKMNISYILDHYNKIINFKKKNFYLKMNDLLSYGQYKNIKKYKKLANLVANDDLTEKRNFFKRIGELSIICYFPQDRNYENNEIFLKRSCDNTILIPLKEDEDPLLTLSKGINDLMTRIFSFPSIFIDSYFDNEKVLFNFENLSVDDELIENLGTCAVPVDDEPQKIDNFSTKNIENNLKKNDNISTNIIKKNENISNDVENKKVKIPFSTRNNHFSRKKGFIPPFKMKRFNEVMNR